MALRRGKTIAIISILSAATLLGLGLFLYRDGLIEAWCIWKLDHSELETEQRDLARRLASRPSPRTTRALLRLLTRQARSSALSLDIEMRLRLDQPLGVKPLPGSDFDSLARALNSTGRMKIDTTAIHFDKPLEWSDRDDLTLRHALLEALGSVPPENCLVIRNGSFILLHEHAALLEWVPEPSAAFRSDLWAGSLILESGKTGVESLKNRLQDEDAYSRAGAAITLGDATDDAKLFISELVRTLDDPVMAIYAVESLGRLGIAAAAAIPAIRQTLRRKPRDESYRHAAGAAWNKILKAVRAQKSTRAQQDTSP